MKNPVHHLRNLAIYENSLTHVFQNDNQNDAMNNNNKHLIEAIQNQYVTLIYIFCQMKFD